MRAEQWVGLPWLAKWLKIVLALCSGLWHNGYNGSIEQTVRIAHMPRKRKTIIIQQIEGLSTGLPPAPKAFTDDFSPEVIQPKVEQTVRAVALPSGQELQDAANREKRRLQGVLLDQLGLRKLKPAPKPAAVKVEGKRAVKLDTVSLHVVLPKWRRDWG